MSESERTVDMAHIIQTKGLGKEFNGVWVLNDIELTLRPGEIHAIVGENGAGKSTFIKILSGVYGQSAGQICIGDEETCFTCVSDSEEAGIRTVHQEINLNPYFAVYQNIFMGSELYRRVFGIKVMKDRAMRKRARQVMERIGIDIDIDTNAAILNTSNMKIVEICKVLVHEPKVVIFDEPTTSLGEEERKKILKVITGLRDKGLSIIYVSHNLEEIQAIADRVTVLRDGCKVGTLTREEIDVDRIITMMIGEKTYEGFARHQSTATDEEMLRMTGVSTHKLKDINLTVKKGEILGIAGVVGAGKTEVAKAVYGLDKLTSGKIEVNGESYKPTPGRSVAKGVALVPEERQAEGIIPDYSVSKNITLTYMDKWSRLGVLKKKEEDLDARQYIDKLSIKTQGPSQLLKFLSGGNQQKVVLSRWLVGDFQLGLFDDPTRGIDVKAREDIYMLMNDLAAQGKSLIVFSSYLPELIGTCDRVIVLKEGRQVGEFKKGMDRYEEHILAAMLGGAS